MAPELSQQIMLKCVCQDADADANADADTCRLHICTSSRSCKSRQGEGIVAERGGGGHALSHK